MKTTDFYVTCTSGQASALVISLFKMSELPRKCLFISTTYVDMLHVYKLFVHRCNPGDSKSFITKGLFGWGVE
jgi:hypothetical protein